MAEAERIAREIESSAHNGNLHMAEERGVIIDDSGADEEDKYSGVVRNEAQLSNLQGDSTKYTPPALRGKTASIDSSKPVAVATAQEPAQTTVQVPAPQPEQRAPTPASQVDSAIISSKITVPSSTPTPKAAPSLATIKPFIPAARKAAAAEAIAASVRKDLIFSPKEKPAAEATAIPSPVVAATGDSVPKTATIKLDNQQIAGTFKQFVHGEKERLTLKKQEMRQKGQEDRLSDLLAFSQSFKLNTPVPIDLVPILAKDKAKQEEIISKSAANSLQTDAKKPLSSAAMAQTGSDVGVGTSKTASPAPPLSARLAAININKQKDDTTSSTPPVPSPVPAKASPTTPTKKLNINAHEFRPNPLAASFTPSFAPRGPSMSPSITPSSAAGTPRLANKSLPAQRPESPSFFGARWKAPSKRSSIKDDFNPFLTLRAEYTGTEPFVLPKTYMSPPTWVLGDSQEISHVEMFVQPEPTGNVRISSIPLPAPVAFSPRGPPSLPSGHVSPSLSGPGSPFVPPPTMYDESMRATLISGASPPIASPNMGTQPMMHSPGQFPTAMTYGQQYPQYYRGGPGPNPGIPPGFMGGPPLPPQQFIQHQGMPGYIPQQQMAPGPGYGSPGRNNYQATMMMPNPSQQGNFNNNGGFYAQPQSK